MMEGQRDRRMEGRTEGNLRNLHKGKQYFNNHLIGIQKKKNSELSRDNIKRDVLQ